MNVFRRQVLKITAARENQILNQAAISEGNRCRRFLGGNRKKPQKAIRVDYFGSAVDLATRRQFPCPRLFALSRPGSFVATLHRPLGPAFLRADNLDRAAPGIAVAEMQVFDLPQLHLASARLIPKLHGGF